MWRVLGVVTPFDSCIFFREALPATNRENPEGRGEGSEDSAHFPTLAAARCRFLLGAASAKNIPLEPPRKRKGEVFTLEAPLPLQSAAKEERAEPRRHSASATSTASCSGPLEPDTGIFPGGPISGIHASPPSVACRHLRRIQGL